MKFRPLPFLIILFWCLGFQNSFAQQLRGTVISDAGEPLVGATVFIPKLKAGAYTNDKGIYSFGKGLSKGKFEVIAFYFGYDTLKKEVEIPAEGIVTLGFNLSTKEFFTNSVNITGEKQTGEINRRDVEIGVTKITTTEINLIPSLGTPDLAQFLQVLPGVVFTGDQGGQLYIRGGTPIQNMVLLDNMIIYSPFHSIGLFSVFDTDYIRNVDVYSAAFPGQYGGRISSVIDIQTRNGNFKEFKGKANITPFTSGVLVEGPLAKGKKPGSGLSVLLSARNNFLDRTSKIFYPYINDTTGLPYNFLDLYGKLTASDGINFAHLFGFRQTDNVNFEFPANIGWEAVGGGGSFQLLPSGAGAILTGTLAYSNYQSELADDQNFPRSSSISGFNGGLKVGYIFNSIDEFNFGLNFQGFSTDYVFTNSFGLQTEQQDANTEAAVYANYKKVILSKKGDGEPFERAVIEPSIRFHYYNNQNALSPELRFRGKLNFERISFSLGLGNYSQNLLSAQSDRDVVNIFQGYLSAPLDLANRIRNNNLQYSRQALFGIEALVIRNVTTNVEGWVKDFTQLSNINRDKLFPNDPDFIAETGLAYGIDVIVKYRTRKTYLYANYGLARVTRTDRLDQESPRTYAPVFDRRHNVNLVAAYKSGRLGPSSEEVVRRRPKFNDPKWEVSLRWNLGSGFPFTQTQGFFEQVDFTGEGAQTEVERQNGDLGILLSDDLNGGRLPYFHRLDLSAKRRWLLGEKVLLESNLSLINTYNRQNIFYFDRIRYEPVFQLPFVPSLGITVKY
ncbi:MAG: TonB-dependent receptor [Bacteroidia bacterium]|nr:TonB-dependent receptor [Bacteroidia bacterium]